MLYFLVLFLTFWVSLFTKEPVALYLTWQNDPHTTMTVCWVTQGKKGKDAEIEYQRIGEGEWKRMRGVYKPLPDKFGFIVHQTELQGLHPNTEYRFRITDDRKVYKFKTLSNNPTHPLHFIVGGDVYHYKLSYLTQMNKQAASLNPAFIVFGGDLAYAEVRKSSKPRKQNRWIDLVASWKTDLISSDGRLIPVVPVIGNHDVSGREGIDPKNAPHFYTLFPIKGYRLFQIDNIAALWLLDSGHTHSVGGDQKNWLEKGLQNKTHFPHKFAIYHVAMYPSIYNFTEETQVEMRKHWLPLFEKYGIKYVFEHHDHSYKRTYPLLNGKIHPNGIIFIGDGGWGTKKARTPKQGYPWYISKGRPKRNFISIRLHGNERHILVYDEKGNIQDELFSRN